MRFVKWTLTLLIATSTAHSASVPDAPYAFNIAQGEKVPLAATFAYDAHCNALSTAWTTPTPPTLGVVTHDTINLPIPGGFGACSGVVIAWDELSYTRTAPASAGVDDHFNIEFAGWFQPSGHVATIVAEQIGKQIGNPCMQPGNSSCGDPISVATGNVHEEVTDYRSAGANSLAFTRYYNSNVGWGAKSTSLGANWRSNFDRSISNPAYNLVVATRPDGKIVSFYATGNTWTPVDSDVNLTLTGSGNSWTLTDIEGTVETYTPSLKTITLRNGYKQTLNYSDGLLSSVTDSYGRSLTFTFTSGAQFHTVTTPDGLVITYGYTGSPTRLMSVTYSTNPATSQSYHYDASGLPSALTSVVDENAHTYQSWTYDGTGRALTSQRGTDANAEITHVSYNDSTGEHTVTSPLGQSEVYPFATLQGVAKISGTRRPAAGTTPAMARTFGYDANGYSNSATDWNGNRTSYVNNTLGQPTTITEPARTTTIVYDPLLNVETQRSVVNASSVIESLTKWAYNARGQALARCEVDATISSATSYTCGASANAPAGVRQSSITYCEQAGIDAGTCPVIGLVLSVDGPRIDVSDKTTYTYYQTTDVSGCAAPGGTCHHLGDLYKVTNALGQVTTYLNYDPSGRVTRVSDANGTLTDLTYSSRGWLLTRTIRANANGVASPSDATTIFTYDAVGNVIKIADPDGAYSAYGYDSAHRLTDITDNAGNAIHYTLDAAGNRTAEAMKDPSGTLTHALSRQFDQLNHLTKLLNASNTAVQSYQNPAEAAPAGITYSNGYDGNGNAIYSVDGNGAGSEQQYDALNRLVKTLQDHTGQSAATKDTATQYAYDTRDNLRSVTDPNSLVTSYTYDGLNNLTALQSPDTGATSYTYDAAGNRITQTDARGIVTRYSYDALNRLTGAIYPTPGLSVSYAYDQPDSVTGCAGSSPAGRLTTMADASVSTTYCYDRRGNVTQATQSVAGTILQTDYIYTRADRLSFILYPSGDIVGYDRDAVGRITAMTFMSGDPIPFISGVSYYPFGSVNTITFANGRTLAKHYDQDYAIQQITSSDPNGFALTARVDMLGNLTRATTPSATRTYQYDPLYRLTQVQDANSAIVESYSYNRTGDRTSKTFAGSTQAYTYAATSHRLQTVAGVSRGYDANGNTTQTSAATLVYNDSNRLSQVASAQYVYNGKGERVTKTLGGTTTIFGYALNGQLLTEYRSPFTCSNPNFFNCDPNFNGLSWPTEYLWMDGTLVGMVRNGNAYYVETDQLGSPRRVIEPGYLSAYDQIVWSWDYAASAFGEVAPNQDPSNSGNQFALDLRFAGQYADAESGFYHNGFRDYAPMLGRYLQSDLIGLRGGVNTYAYADDNPLGYIDPSGQNAIVIGGEIGSVVEPGGGTVVGMTVGGVITGAIAIHEACKDKTCLPCTPYPEGTIGYIGPHNDDHFNKKLQRNLNPHINLFEVNQNKSDCKCRWNRAKDDSATPLTAT